MGVIKNLKEKQLRHVSPAFSEDPLRAMRAVQFAARFSLDIVTKTQEMCMALDLNELPKERIYEEFKKLLLKAHKPSMGLEWMRKMKMLKYFPELEALIDVPQEPEWHPEGDVWIHNNMVVDEAAKLRDQDFKDNLNSFECVSFMFGALCHDFGKPVTTIKKEGRWRSPAHDVKGEKPTKRFLKRLTNERKLIDTVITYVREH